MSYLFLALSIIGIELYVKNKAEREWSPDENVPVIGGSIRLNRHHNKGAFLSMMKSKRRLLLLLSCLLTGGIAIFFCLTLFQKGNHLLKLGLSLLLGGAFSNTYDRLKRQYVVDYFSFNTPFKALNRIVFNLSDFCILIGSLLSVLGRSK